MADCCRTLSELGESLDPVACARPAKITDKPTEEKKRVQPENPESIPILSILINFINYKIAKVLSLNLKPKRVGFKINFVKEPKSTKFENLMKIFLSDWEFAMVSCLPEDEQWSYIMIDTL